MSWRSCVRKGGCLYETVQAIRWFPVLIVMAACGWGYYAYVYQLSIETVDNWPQRIIYILGFHILLILFVTSYFKTIFTPPAKPPREFCFEGEELEEIRSSQDDERKLQAVLNRYVNQRKLPIRVKGLDNGVRFCDKCKCIKPDRSHHCSMCGQCVLKFDHHCPWVNNCVNFSNYKFFLLFLGYGFSFCIWIFLTDLPYFIDFWKTEFNGTPIKGGRFHLLFLVFVSAMFALSLSALFFYHLYLTAKNRSTVESFRAPLIDGRYEKNAFNHGIRANYREVFGSRRLLWFLPIYSTLGDGVKFTKWSLQEALAAQGVRGMHMSRSGISGLGGSGNNHGGGGGGSTSIGALRYQLLNQQDEEETLLDRETLYSDEDDEDLNIRAV